VEELDRRITVRTGLMLEAGWIPETQAALDQYPADCPGLMSIGYREIVQFLQRDLRRGDLEKAIILVTRKYAKRQRTWFRKVPYLKTGLPEDEALIIEIHKWINGTAEP
jgi:tRNA dimethylallyltransferase